MELIIFLTAIPPLVYILVRFLCEADFHLKYILRGTHQRHKELVPIPRAFDLYVESERKALEAWENWFRQELGEPIIPQTLEYNIWRLSEWIADHDALHRRRSPHDHPSYFLGVTEGDMAKEAHIQLKALTKQRQDIIDAHYYL